MSILTSLRGTGSRRAVDEVERLRDENRMLLANYHRAGDDVALLQWDLDVALRRQTEIEGIVTQQQTEIFDLSAERDHLAKELAALKARFVIEMAADANRDAVTVPPAVRDTTAVEDQATGPIYVRPLQEAAEEGHLSPIIRISTSGSSANPTHLPAPVTRDEPAEGAA